MREVTLDDLIAEVHTKEAATQEPAEVTAKIGEVSKLIEGAAMSTDRLKILTDYDADGICSAYIMEKTIRSVNPDADIEVICNDRRNPYGVPKDISAEENTRYIVLDMGSNELDYIRNTFGVDTIILDHHLIEDDEARKAFINDNTLLNPHSMADKDGDSAKYCATGLAYRVYQTVSETNKEFQHDVKQDNTVAIMACIGTVTDMVDVLDTKSNNREIIKNGLKLIDNADETNTNFVIGHMLAQCGIGKEDVTAHQIAFNVGAFINSASRMSEITQENGAMKMYNAISGNEHSARTYFEISSLVRLNSERKNYIQNMQDENYHGFIEQHRFNDDKNIAVFLLDDNTPSAFCGLMAGKLTESTGKAVICLTYNEESGLWSGSGRNGENMTSLKGFIDNVVNTLDMENVNIKYGGHNDAIGISELDNLVKFATALDNHSELLQKNDNERVILKIDASEIGSQETLQKLQALEPTGTGFKLPPVIIEGKELRKNQGFLKGHKDWKKISIKDLPVQVNDWSYSPDIYPQDKKGNIKLLADISIGTYGGQHTELTAKWDKNFFQHRQSELTKGKSSKTIEHD